MRAGILSGLEQKTEDWIDSGYPKIDESDIRDIALDLKEENAVLNGNPEFPSADFTHILDDYLRANGHLEIRKGTEAYEKLWTLFRKATSENQVRLIERLENGSFNRRDFPKWDAHSILPPPPRQQITLGKFLDEFMDYQRETHAETTPAAYKLPVRVLREVIGEEMPLYQITRQHVEKACRVMKKVPLNMTQRYPFRSNALWRRKRG